ncbi:MAG: hypothetical protein ACREYE_24000 [Gammaproteobacteria bacterium]
MKNLLRSGSRVPAVLGILMYFNIPSGCSSHPWDSPLRGLRAVSLPAKRSSAPAEHDIPSLATIFSQALSCHGARVSTSIPSQPLPCGKQWYDWLGPAMSLAAAWSSA